MTTFERQPPETMPHEGEFLACDKHGNFFVLEYVFTNHEGFHVFTDGETTYRTHLFAAWWKLPEFTPPVATE